jgi:hypothetical protein
MSMGASIQNLSKTPIKISFTPKKGEDDQMPIWPNLVPFRINIQEPESGDKRMYYFPPTEHVLVINLSKTTSLKLKISSYFDESDPRISLENMGLWNWHVEEFDPNNPADMNEFKRQTDQARDGLMLLLTHYVELSLVHAVQQPI